MRLIKRSNSLKIVIIVMLMSATLLFPAIFLVQCARGLIIDELNKNALNIAVTAASFIEQDVDAFKGIPAEGVPSPGSLSEAYYNDLLIRLEQIRSNSGAMRIFTEKRMTDQMRASVLDGSVKRSGQPSRPPENSRVLSPTERRAFDEGVMLASGLLRDSTKGEYITGYAPVIDSATGQPVGVVGVEFPLTYAQRIITGFGSIIWSVFGVIMLLTSFVIFSLVKSRVKYYQEDFLTGLLNKRYFEKSLNKSLRYVKRTGRKLCLVMVDVDRFKSINDTLGHTAGDAVLRSVARHIRGCVRSSDLCFRYGGDEFILTLADASKEKAFEIAERIRKEMKTIGVRTESGEPVVVSLSMGIAEYEGTESATELVECADKALYISKNTGKDKTTVYDGEAA